MPDGAAKVCIRCKQDCSSKPRMKDAQGRYTCKECVEKLKRAAAQKKVPAQASAASEPDIYDTDGPLAPADDNAAILSNLLKGEPVATEPCPSCGIFMAPNVAICVSCGYNKETGKQIRTHTVAAPRERRQRKSREPSALAETLTSPMALFFGLIALYGGLFALSMTEPAMILALIIVVAVGSIATMIYEIVAAFADEDTGWGIVAICQIVPCVGGICSLAMLYYVFAISERGHLKAMLGSTLIGAVFYIFAIAMNPEFMGSLG